MADQMSLVLLRRAEHVLFGALLVVGAVRTGGAAAVASAAALAGWYVLGIALARRGRGRTVGIVWLAVLAAGWAGLAVLSVDFVWLAFPLFLLAMQVLPAPLGVPAVVLLTAGAVTTIALHRGRFDPAAVLGPVVGAAVAVVITLVYRDLRRESARRADLLAELTEAQDRLARSERYAGTLAERERLAREIHDTVAQGLSGIVLVLRTARDADPDTARGAIDTATDAARTALADTRRLVRALTPAELAGRSLPEALRRVVAAAPYATLTVDGEPAELPTPVEVALLRAAQEALHNVRAHAGAERAVVTLTYLPEVVRLDVVDDGRGFDPAVPPAASTTGTGLGLAAMRDRLAEVDGTLVVESAPGHGTALGVTVPLGSTR
ncbi:sensor histidine kinase [Actinocatenispora rupis]|uniref:Oxygen sensor histidine kinase NreB n=1 Tax=Actinocatenispora rupis TaxID=519421 RepID=A0A8J3ND49_9ACTN|nr:sensor histidine kinase [Actinocatenispora rupis]GID12560.1 two-component sensor histidine kinase [Actinocatenispora rupis]